MFKNSKSKHLNLLNAYKEADNLIGKIPVIKKKRNAKKIKNFFIYFCSFVLALFLLFILLFGKEIILAKKIISDSLEGKKNIEQSIDFIRGNDFQKAIFFADKGNIYFSRALENAQKIKTGFFVEKISYVRDQADDLECLVATTQILSRSLKEAAIFVQDLENLLEGDKKISFSKFSKEEKKKIIEKIYFSSPELAGMKANLDLAMMNLEKIKFRGIFRFLESRILDIQAQIREADETLAKAIPISQILPILGGYPEKSNFLVLLQNSDELRPTGGFLGTYGILEVEFGDILNFETHDIYHMDMPVKDKINIAPPAPLEKYLGVKKWYLRDANWSPDWPESAQKIEWFYQKENDLLGSKKVNNFNGEFNGVIGITPEFVTDLLDLVGPIEIEGTKYDKNNFTQLLEYRVEKGYMQLGVSSWQRKEVIAKIARELKIKLFDLPSSRLKDIVKIIDKNISRKNILVFVKDEEVEKLIKEKGWGGEMKNASGDYLMVVDANMAALKTDAVVNRNIEYTVEQRSDGLVASLKINYSHNGGFDWRTTRYRTYTRIFVPKGSQLIKSSGVSEGDVEVGNDVADKTYFGVFKSIEPGSTGSLYLEYKLPENLNKQSENGEYSLYVQKQPGNNTNNLIVDLKLQNVVKSYNPASFYTEKVGSNELRWENDFNTDKIFEAKF